MTRINKVCRETLKSIVEKFSKQISTIPLLQYLRFPLPSQNQYTFAGTVWAGEHVFDLRIGTTQSLDRVQRVQCMW